MDFAVVTDQLCVRNSGTESFNIRSLTRQTRLAAELCSQHCSREYCWTSPGCLKSALIDLRGLASLCLSSGQRIIDLPLQEAQK